MGTHTISVNKDNFKAKVLDSNKPVIIDLWAEWCMPCKMITKAIDEIAKDYKDKVDVGKIDVDSNPELATELSVMNIPTIIFFKGGKEVGRMVGVNPKVKIEKKIKEYFS